MLWLTHGVELSGHYNADNAKLNSEDRVHYNNYGFIISSVVMDRLNKNVQNFCFKKK